MSKTLDHGSNLLAETIRATASYQSNIVAKTLVEQNKLSAKVVVDHTKRHVKSVERHIGAKEESKGRHEEFEEHQSDDETIVVSKNQDTSGNSTHPQRSGHNRSDSSSKRRQGNTLQDLINRKKNFDRSKSQNNRLSVVKENDGRNTKDSYDDLEVEQGLGRNAKRSHEDFDVERSEERTTKRQRSEPNDMMVVTSSRKQPYQESKEMVTNIRHEPVVEGNENSSDWQMFMDVDSNKPFCASERKKKSFWDVDDDQLTRAGWVEVNGLIFMNVLTKKAVKDPSEMSPASPLPSPNPNCVSGPSILRKGPQSIYQSYNE